MARSHLASWLSCVCLCVAGCGDEYVAVSSGWDQTCGRLAGGGVRCWGNNGGAQLEVPDGTYRSVSAGFWATCAVDEAGAPRCVGSELSGLGAPPDAARDLIQVDVAVSNGVACALDEEGEVLCWGRADELVENVPTGGGFSHVEVGHTNACALAAAGTIECWGWDGQHWACEAQCTGSNDPPASGTMIDLAVGGQHACAIASDGAVVCWGMNDEGQADPPAGRFLSVDCGDRHCCGIRGDDAEVVCWGADEHGQSSAPALAAAEVSAGARHSCAVRTDGSVTCWGANDLGQASAP